MAGAILVTGSTGNVGSEVVNQLSKAGKTVIAARRSSSTTRKRKYIEYRQFDFTKPNTWGNALEGVDRVFLVRPPHISNVKRDLLPFLEYLKEKNIKQLVFLSVQGAENNKIIPHHKIEKSIVKLGIPYTFLRASFFMQNLTTTHLKEICDEKRLFVPTGAGKTNFIDVRDIAEIAVATLTGRKYINKAFTITGDESYSYQEVAEHLTNGLKCKIDFVNARLLPFFRYHHENNRNFGMTLVMYTLYSVVRSGKADISTNDSEKILGRKPKSLDKFIKDHKKILLGEVECHPSTLVE